MLAARSSGGVRINMAGQKDILNQLPSSLRSRLHPLPTNAEVAVTSKPMRINPTPFSLGDYFNALSSNIKGCYG